MKNDKLLLEISQEDPRFIQVFWAGELLRRLCKHLFFKELIKLERLHEKLEFLSALHHVEKVVARQEVIRLLSRKGYCTEELKKKLFLKGFDSSVIEYAIDYCLTKGYLNDVVYADRLISRELQKGRGSQWIYFKLKQKKLFDHDKPADMEGQERLSLKKLIASKKYQKKNQPKQVLVQKLLQRGYSYDAIRAVLFDRPLA